MIVSRLKSFLHAVATFRRAVTNMARILQDPGCVPRYLHLEQWVGYENAAPV